MQAFTVSGPYLSMSLTTWVSAWARAPLMSMVSMSTWLELRTLRQTRAHRSLSTTPPLMTLSGGMLRPSAMMS